MTTPPPDEPAAGSSPAPEATGPSAETAPQPASPPAGPPPPPPLPPPPPGAEYAGFAPVPRPPRMPWVNPARRTQLVGWAVVASVLLIGAGFGIGYGVAGSDDDDHYGPGRMYHDYLPYDMRGHMGGAQQPSMMRPGQHLFPRPGVSTTTVTVTPSPASTS